MKRYLFPLTISAYLALLLIDTAQLVGLYSDLVGERGVGVSPWLSLFSLNLTVLLLSFRRPEWGSVNPAGVFAFIIGLLHFLFFTGRISATTGQFDWMQLLPAALFSIFFSYAIYFLADQLASMSEEMTKERQESMKQFEERAKEFERNSKEFEERLNIRESDAKKADRFLKMKEQLLNEREEKMKEAGKRVKYGNGFVKIDFLDGKWTIKKVA